jgi:hypothetical protein
LIPTTCCEQSSLTLLIPAWGPVDGRLTRFRTQASRMRGAHALTCRLAAH